MSRGARRLSVEVMKVMVLRLLLLLHVARRRRCGSTAGKKAGSA